MPRKNTMRENVAAVRNRLPHLSNMPREQIELALLHYESNVDHTVEAFQQNGAAEALNGWIEPRENGSSRRSKARGQVSPSATLTNNKKAETVKGPLRPSQRVSNMFQMFAENGKINSTSNGHSTSCTPTSSSTSFIDQLESPSMPSGTLESTTTPVHSESPIANVDEPSVTFNCESKNSASPRRVKSSKTRLGSSSSHKNEQQSRQKTNSSSATTTVTNNRKMLIKSAKDLQRQSSTLSNVDLTFNNEIQSSIKCIDDVFKQIRELIKEREVQLYLELDQVREQGLQMIHRHQQRTIELRERMDRCDRLSVADVEILRNDIKQFVTERRYELGEALGSSHRFEFDTSVIEALKQFGYIRQINRKHSLPTSAMPEETTENQSILTEKPNPIMTNEARPLPQRVVLKPSDLNTKVEPLETSVKLKDDPTANPAQPVKLSNGSNAHRHDPRINGDHQTIYNKNQRINSTRRPRPRPRPEILTNRTAVSIRS